MNAPSEPLLLQAMRASSMAGATGHTAAVAHLCAALDEAFDACRTPGKPGTPADPSRCAAFARGVRAALAQALADPTLVTVAQREGSAEKYRRHLIAADPHGRYAVASLVWQPGQASPIHAHHTWCGYAVLEGTLTEMLYAWDEARQGAEVVRAHLRAAGAINFGGRGRANIHRLFNGSASTCISLHVYGVSGGQFATHVNDIVPLVASETCARDAAVQAIAV
ncbi:cysteine dioxygenase family protein [Paraburkholderia tagetis]|uniref:Cysteine dioxygenase family protein n=1 Tax=Paraburkholderia tagetis TaxID=2913261 RepID=A0A9X1UHS0_9BURK|nr:cysteine dioxygenase family protein [Paraburkholderia tagetis]MCG5074032.1 cysteine dioxygenase family protein [Paraburkholderia tagetis]